MNTIHDRMHRNASPSIARLKRKALPLSLSLLGMVAGSLLPCGDASAAGPAAGTLPTGNSVVSGTAVVNTTGTTLTVTQTSAQLAMNWSTFDIASNATVNFAQPSANSIALNRIGIGSSSPAPSQIFGNLTANGQLFLINPAGIVFGAGSTINVGGLVASTLDMDPTTLGGGAQSFHLDNNSGGGASVLNHGTINAATGGGVALVGSSVGNDGQIVASAGHIFMDGADHATLDFDGNNLINVTITGGVSSASGTAAVSNSGNLFADGGTVVLRATATPGLFTQMVNNSGVVEANGISNVNGGAGGSVQLIGSGGAISNSGTVTANGAAGGAAGSVVVSSDSNQSISLGGTVSTTGLAGGGISLSGGSLALSGAVNADASTVTLNSAADITQSGTSVVTAGLLTGSSTGNATLSNSNAIQSVGNFNSGAGFALNNAATLQVGGLAANGAAALTTTGTGSNLTFNGNVSAQSLSLNSGGAISQSGGVLTTGTLSGSSVGGTSLGDANQVNSLAGFSANGFTLVNASALNVSGAVNSSGGGVNLYTTSGGLTVNGTVSGSNVSLTSGGALVLGADVTASQALSLSGAAITQTAGALTATLLTGQSIGDTSLNSISNSVGQLGNFSAANFNLTNGGALVINGPLNTSGNATVTTSAGNLSVQGVVSGSNVTLTGGNNVSLSGNVSANNNLTLNGASINQTSGTLSANTLTGSSANATSLTQANTISTLGGFTAGGFSLTNAGALNVTGPLISTGGLSLTTTSGSLQVAGTLSGSTVSLSGSSGIGLANNVSATGGLNLSSGNGAITQTAGTVTTSLLTGNSYGATTLGGLNQISQISGFTAGGFKLNTGNALNVIGPLISLGDLTLTNTSGDLSLNGLVSGQTVSLTSLGGAVNQVGGSLSAATLTGSSANGTSLGSGGNLISSLGTYSSGGNFTLATAGNLQITGAVNGSAVALNANSGSITEASGGSITAATLTGSSSGATTLNQVNQIASLGAYNSSGDFSLSNGQAITGSGALQVQGKTTLRAGGQSITLTNTNNNLVGTVSISGGTTQINNNGALTFDTSSILGDLTATTTNATIGQVGALNVTGNSTFNAGTGAIVLTNAGNTLSIPALKAVSATGTGIAITNNGDLKIGSLLDGANGAVSLISSDTLTLPSMAINTGTADLTLESNGGPLATQAALSGNNVTLAGSQGLGLAHNVTATGTLDLRSDSGAITQTAGMLGADTLTATSPSLIALNQSGNQIAQLGNVSANTFSLTNSEGLVVNGALNSGAVTLNVTGALSEASGGSVVANSFSGSSTGSTALTQAGNQIVQLNGYTANGFSLINNSALTVAGPLTSTAGATLITQNGDLTLAGSVSGDDVTLRAVSGAITQQSGSLTASTLSGLSQGATTLNQAGNQVVRLNNFTADGFSLVNGGPLIVNGPLTSTGTLALETKSGDLTLAGDVNGTGVTLTSDAGAITQQGGSLTATTLAGSSYGGTTLNQAGNQINQLGNYTANGFQLTNAGALTVNGALNSTGDVALKTATGDLTLAGTIDGGNVSLSALGGAVNQTAGLLTAGTLSGQSAGATSLTQSGNVISQLGPYSSGGNFSLTDTVALAQSGPLQVLGNTVLNAGAHAVTLNNSGNDLHGTVALTAGDTQIANDRALTFAASTINGNLDASASNANIGQAGALNVTGNSSFQAGIGAIALADTGNALGQTVNASGTGIAITNSGDLHMGTLNDGANGAVTLIAGGTLYLPAGAINTGTSDLTLTSNGGALATAADLAGNNVTLTSGQGITLAHNVTANGVLDLVGGQGAITQTAGVLAANTLTGSSQGVASLNQANQIAQLGAFSADGFSLVNARALTVNGPLTSGGDVALTTTGGDLSLNGTVSGAGVTLASNQGAINQTGGALVANTLSAHSSGATSLKQGGNAIANLGSVSTGGDFSLTSTNAVTVSGVLASGGNVALATGGNLTLANAVSGQNVSLNAGAGAIVQTSGSLTAGTLNSNSAGSTQLAQANQVGSLGSASSGGDFIFTNGTAITQSGALVVQGATTLNAGNNAITLTQGGNDLRGTLSVTGGDTQIVSSGPLMFGTSQINGDLSVTSTDPTIGQSGALSVTGSSYFNAGNGSIELTNANNQLAGPMSAIGTGIAITNAGDLRIASLSNGANGAVSLISTGGTLTLPGTAIATGMSDLLLSSGGGSLSTAAGLSGANVSLSGNKGINLGHDVTATNTLSLVSSNGGITQTAGVLSAAALSGSAAGAVSLKQANQLRSIGSFSANGFSLTNANGLVVSGPLLSNGDLALVTQNGGLSLTGTVSGNHVTLDSAGGITESGGGNIVATTLSGSAGGATVLGTHDAPAANRIATLGGFDSPAGFSLTNDRTLTLASVDGSSYSVNAGTSPFYIWVLDGDLLQLGTTPLYNSQGTFAASGRIGTVSAPIYEFGTLPYVVESIGMPPAYFYALDRQGNPLSEAGFLSINIPTTMSSGRAQNGNNRMDSYIDASVITASYRAYGIVPSGIRLPPDQEACDPKDPDCQND